MPETITHHQALIYIMITMSAADRRMTDRELAQVGNIVQMLPIFRDFDAESLVKVAEECADLLNSEEGLDRVLGLVTSNLPSRLYETAYTLAVDVASADGSVKREENRLLEIIADRLGIDALTVAAIHRAARARYAVLPPKA